MSEQHQNAYTGSITNYGMVNKSDHGSGAAAYGGTDHIMHEHGGLMGGQDTNPFGDDGGQAQMMGSREDTKSTHARTDPPSDFSSYSGGAGTDLGGHTGSSASARGDIGGGAAAAFGGGDRQSGR